MLLPDPTSSWLFKPINSRIRSKDAMFDEHPSLCELWPKLFFSLTEELSPKACQSHIFSVESAQMSQGSQCKTCRRNEALTQKFSKHFCVESVQEKYLFALGDEQK
jgi:hypothetical protein